MHLRNSNKELITTSYNVLVFVNIFPIYSRLPDQQYGLIYKSKYNIY